MAERFTRLRSGQIRSITPDDVEATNEKVDTYIPTYDSDSGNFTWKENVGTVGLVIDGAEAEISVGAKGSITIPYNAEILEWTILADQLGDIQIDIWKDSYVNYPPTDEDSICGANEVVLSSAIKGTDSTLTDWTKTISAGDILSFYVDSCTDITKITLLLKLKKT